MTRATFSTTADKWRFGVALAGAAVIHLAAISFATAQRVETTVEGIATRVPEVSLERGEPNVDSQPDPSEPLPTPPVIEQSYIEDSALRPPVHLTPTRFPLLVRPLANPTGKSLNVSAAKVFALSAPRPDYPYEARRQKITGEGVALLTIDPSNGEVINITMSKSTGNPLLDNAARAGLGRWRFKPGTVSSVTCPITFSLTGVTY